jgi:hypothetical protein
VGDSDRFCRAAEAVVYYLWGDVKREGEIYLCQETVWHFLICFGVYLYGMRSVDTKGWVGGKQGSRSC